MSGLISGRGIQLDGNHLAVSGDDLQMNVNSDYLAASGSGIGLNTTIGGAAVTFNTTPLIANAPTTALEAANKAYVDSLAAGLAWKDSVRVASTGDVTISGPGAAIDGVTLANGDRILLKDQGTASENGIWVFNGAAAALTRPTDYPNGGAAAATTVIVEEGTAHGDSIWRTPVDDGSDVIDTNAVTFSELPLVAYTAGNGISLAGNAIAVVADATTGGDTAAVSVSGNGVGLDVTTLDGDHLRVDFTPTNYTPATTPAEASNVDDLAAHLFGADAFMGGLQTLAGVTGGATNLGTFTGSTITDNVTIKAALQELETAVEAAGAGNASTTVAGAVELATNAEAQAGTATGGSGASLVVTAANLDNMLTTLIGTTSGQYDLDTFTGSTIADNSSIKDALQSLETAVESAGGAGFETFTLAAGDITAKQVTLAAAPTAATVQVHWTEGGSAANGAGVTVTGSNVNWNGQAWDGVLQAGDVLLISYTPA